MKTLGRNSIITWWQPTLLVYGDFGFKNSQSLPRLKKEVDGGKVDGIFHIGDMGYNMFDVRRKPDINTAHCNYAHYCIVTILCTIICTFLNGNLAINSIIMYAYDIHV